MKQMILLEPDDVIRLKTGHTIQLTDHLMIGILTRANRRVMDTTDSSQKKAYKCDQCEKTFLTPAGRGSHRVRAHGKLAKRRTL